jgi:hypothetical protein
MDVRGRAGLLGTRPRLPDQPSSGASAVVFSASQIASRVALSTRHRGRSAANRCHRCWPQQHRPVPKDLQPGEIGGTQKEGAEGPTASTTSPGAPSEGPKRRMKKVRRDPIWPTNGRRYVLTWGVQGDRRSEEEGKMDPVTPPSGTELQWAGRTDGTQGLQFGIRSRTRPGPLFSRGAAVRSQAGGFSVRALLSDDDAAGKCRFQCRGYRDLGSFVASVTRSNVDDLWRT